MASATAPVQEVLEDGKSALLVAFFDVAAQVAALTRLLDDAALRQALASEAQKRAFRYSSSTGLAAWRNVLGLEVNT